jgi:hypothetical protein
MDSVSDPSRARTVLRWLLAALAPALLLAPSLSACGTSKPRPARVRQLTPDVDSPTTKIYMKPVEPTTRTVVSKNYTLGARREAAVGEPMVGVRNYTAADRVVAAIVLRDFRQLCRKPAPEAAEAAKVNTAWDQSMKGDDPLAPYVCKSNPLKVLRGSPGDRIEVAGGFSDQGKTYYLLRLPTDSGSLYLATDRRGALRPTGYAAWRSNSASSRSANGLPLDVLETPVPLETDGPIVRYLTEESVIASGADHLNYELIYRGTTYDHGGMMYHILYKEYRRDSVEVPIYTQDLPFTADSKIVDVLGLRIRVHDVNARQIAYTVERD